MTDILDYIQELKDKGDTVVIFIDSEQFKSVKTDQIKKVNSEPYKLIGKIKYILKDSIVLEKSTKFEEIAVLLNRVVTIRKWTEKE